VEPIEGYLNTEDVNRRLFWYQLTPLYRITRHGHWAWEGIPPREDTEWKIWSTFQGILYSISWAPCFDNEGPIHCIHPTCVERFEELQHL
jgi:hypothetical protein